MEEIKSEANDGLGTSIVLTPASVLSAPLPLVEEIRTLGTYHCVDFLSTFKIFCSELTRDMAWEAMNNMIETIRAGKHCNHGEPALLPVVDIKTVRYQRAS